MFTAEQFDSNVDAKKQVNLDNFGNKSKVYYTPDQNSSNTEQMDLSDTELMKEEELDHY